jgi:zinc protease
MTIKIRNAPRVLAFALALVPATLPAQAAPRPVIGTPKTFTTPAVHERALPNGLRVALVPYGVTPMARIELVIRTGRAYEGANEAGLAQLVGDYLLEGSTSRSASTIAAQLASLGTAGVGLAVSVGTHETLIACETLAESTPAVIRLLSEIVLAPAFDAAALDRLKANYRRRVQSGTTSAAALAAARVNATLFPGDVSDRFATEEALARITVADVRAYHAAHYVARRSRLYVAGSFDRMATGGAVEQAFATMTSGTPAPALRGSASMAAATPGGQASTTGAVIQLIDRPGATQSRLQVSYAIVDQPHPDHLALNELNSLMGSMQTSRIIANVRERNGYSYNVSSRLLRRPAATTWTVQADVNRDVTAAALREILGEIDRLPVNPPSPQELRGFQQFMSGGTMLEMATSRGILDYLRFLDLYGTDIGYLSNLVPSIFALKPADLLRVHAQYMQPERRVIVVVGDAASVEAGLRNIGRVERIDR